MDDSIGLLPEKGQKEKHYAAAIQQAKYQITKMRFFLLILFLGDGQNFIAG